MTNAGIGRIKRKNPAVRGSEAAGPEQRRGRMMREILSSFSSFVKSILSGKSIFFPQPD
jgi:hypothetical protein